MDELCVGDLLLAFACASGSSRAVDLFDAAFFGDLDLILSRMTMDQDVFRDVAQTLRIRLFVGQGSSPPKILQYSGTGSLRRWFRVTATRHAISILRKPRREFNHDDHVALVPAASADPELKYLCERYQHEFRQAFEEAVKGLPSRDRNLLRYHYVDRLNIDEIGAIRGIHRVSAARHLTKVRASLIVAVRERLKTRLRVGTKDLTSILRLVVQSGLDVSLREILNLDSSSLDAGDSRAHNARAK